MGRQKLDPAKKLTMDPTSSNAQIGISMNFLPCIHDVGAISDKTIQVILNKIQLMIEEADIKVCKISTHVGELESAPPVAFVTTTMDCHVSQDDDFARIQLLPDRITRKSFRAKIAGKPHKIQVRVSWTQIPKLKRVREHTLR